MIVIGHSQTAVGRLALAQGRDFQRWNGLPWGASVDLFFVISGFIMVYSSQRLFGRDHAWCEFLIRRTARIVPLYWLCTTAYIILLIAAAAKGGDGFPAFHAVLASYIFLPFGDLGHLNMPIYDIGWTLNYEMFFYMLFALCVGLGRKRATMAVIGILLALALAGQAARDAPTFILFWTRPIIIDFGMGVIVGSMCRSGIALPKVLRVGAVAVGTILFCVDPLSIFTVPMGTTVANGWPRVLLAGIPAALVMAGLVLGPQRSMPLRLRPAAMVGDASYSLYLTHPFILIVMEKLLQKIPSLTALPLSAVVFAVVLGAIIAAIFIFHWIEQPLTRLADRLLRGIHITRKRGLRTTRRPHFT